MPTPKELTDRFIHAYNQRDRVALRALLPPVLEYVRPGGGRLTTADEVMAQYERDWAVLGSSNVEVRDLVESGDGIIAEITIRATMGGGSLAVEGVSLIDGAAGGSSATACTRIPGRQTLRRSNPQLELEGSDIPRPGHHPGDCWIVLIGVQIAEALQRLTTRPPSCRLRRTSRKRSWKSRSPH